MNLSVIPPAVPGDPFLPMAIVISPSDALEPVVYLAKNPVDVNGPDCLPNIMVALPDESASAKSIL